MNISYALSLGLKRITAGFLGLIALLSCCCLTNGQTFSYTGSLSSPNQVFQIWFTLPSSADVTLKTTSWNAGNFDPVVWLFDANGNQVAKNDDACNGVGCSPVSRDSLVQLTALRAGTYTALVSAYDQHYWRAGAAGNPPGVIVTGWSYQGDFGGLPPNFAATLITSVNINAPFTQTIFPPSDTGTASPALISPANGATGVALTPTLSWSSVSGTDGYMMYLGTSNPPTTPTQVSGTSFTTAALKASTTYYWKVASRDPVNADTENPSLIWSFTTASAAPPPLPAPTLVSPANGSTGLSLRPTLTWSPVAGTNGYNVYLGTSNPPTAGTPAAGSSFSPVTALNPATTYYWRVASRDPYNHNAEASSAVWSFTTAAPLPAPTLSAPANASSGVSTSPTLTWNAVGGSSGYTVYFGATNPPTAGTFSGVTSFTPGTLGQGTTYYWRVASRDPNNGNAESVSGVWSFTTAAAVVAPTLLAPTTGATNVSVTPTLSWNAVTGSAGYTVYLGTVNPPTTGAAVTSTSYAPAALTAGTTYYWMVASRDPNNNNKEANSAVWSFTTAAAIPAPTLVAPTTGATNVSVTPTLSWNAVTGSAGYTVYLGTVNPPTTGAAVTSTSYAPAALTAGTTYYWMVASRDPNNNNKEANSTVWSFTTAAAMPAPTLLAPTTGATNVSVTPTLSWSAVTGTSGYTVYLGTANPPTTGTAVTSTSYAPAALTAGTTYYWMVASRDPNNNNKEANSTVWSFTTAAAVPAPTLVAPTTGATNVSVTPTLSWNAVTGSAGYTVYLGTANPPTTGAAVTSTSYAPAALTAGTTYYWMVASRDPNNNNKEANSAVWSFTTAAAMPAPTLLAPTTGATNVSVTPTLSWSAVTGTSGYTVYLGTANPPTTGTAVTSTSYAPAALTAGTTYYWMVASRDPNNNNKEANSAVWSFTTAAAMPAPTLLAPATGATNVSVTPTLSWNAVTGSAGYTVYLGTANPPTAGTAVTSTSYAPAALTAGTTYYWMVASRDPNNGNKEADSAVWSFTTAAAMPAPTLLAPATGATNVSVTPTLSWSAVTGTSGYTVYLGTANPPTVGAAVTSTSYAPAALTAGTTYYWMVASRDPNNNNKEANSAVWSFTTAAAMPAPTLLAPATGATNVSVTPTLSWSAVTGTSGYTVYLGTANPPTVGTAVTGTSYTPAAALTAATTYYWMVASRDPNNNNKEANSAVWSFTTAAAMPAPTLLAPTTGATNVSVTPTLSWGAVTGTSGYTVYLGTVNPPTTGAAVTSTSYAPAALTAGTTYYWMVASRDPNNNNKEANSTVWSFTTAAAVSAPTLLAPATGATNVSVTPTLSWNAVTGSAGYTVYLGTVNPPTTGAAVTSTSYAPAALTAGTTYYWMVASRDPNNGNKEANSAVWSFTTAAAIPAPTLLAPTTGATNVSVTPTLSWNSVTGTAGYTVYLGTANPPTVGTAVTGTSYTPAPLTAATTYYWMVASRDPNNANKEANSAVWSFTTASPTSNGYRYHRTVTILHGNIPNTDQTNFPFLFNSTDALLKTTVNGGRVNQANGYDIIFTSDAGGTQKLDHEIEYYNGATGQFVAWVRIPSLSHLTDTSIYMFYGNTNIALSQENKPGVWDSTYKTVYHMADNAASTTVTDSTGHHPAANQVNTNTRSVSGKIDGALTFDGNNDFVSTADGADLQANSGKTVSFWIKPSDLSGATTYRVLCEYSDANNDWSVVAETAGNADANTIRADIKVAGSETHLKIADNSITAGVFYYVTVVFNNAVPSAIYLNGVSSPLLVPKQGILGYGTTPRFTIGARNDNARAFPGIIDEVRVSSAIRSADWIRAEYNNQSNPAGFYALGAEFTALANAEKPVVAAVNETVDAQPASGGDDVVTELTLPTLQAAVRNGASLATGAVSPGEIVILEGTGLSSSAYAAQPEAAQGLPRKLGDTQVFFDGIEAPLLWVRSNQLAAIVPYDFEGRGSARVWVTRRGIDSNRITLDVADAAPGVFTQNASGHGQALALNAGGTLNTTDEAAAPGSTITLYITGAGARPLAVLIGGKVANVVYAGAVPGITNGVWRIDFIVPDGIESGAVPVVVRIGDASSQGGVMVNVR